MESDFQEDFTAWKTMVMLKALAPKTTTQTMLSLQRNWCSMILRMKKEQDNQDFQSYKCRRKSSSILSIPDSTNLNVVLTDWL